MDAPDKNLDWALEDFSGYVAVHELFDGPFCVVSAVDNHTFCRLIHEVLDYGPTDEDIRRFLERLQTHVRARQKRVLGVATPLGSQAPREFRAKWEEAARKMKISIDPKE